jgi:hypothetical protein
MICYRTFDSPLHTQVNAIRIVYCFCGYTVNNHYYVAASSVLLTTFKHKGGTQRKGVVYENDFVKRPVSRESIHEVNTIPESCKLARVIPVKVFNAIDHFDPFNNSIWCLILIRPVRSILFLLTFLVQ